MIQALSGPKRWTTPQVSCERRDRHDVTSAAFRVDDARPTRDALVRIGLDHRRDPHDRCDGVERIAVVVEL